MASRFYDFHKNMCITERNMEGEPNQNLYGVRDIVESTGIFQIHFSNRTSTELAAALVKFSQDVPDKNDR